MVPTWTSPGLWFPYGALLDLVPVVSFWPHLEQHDSDPYLGLTWTWGFWSLPGHHWFLVLVTGLLYLGLTWTW